jgi:hypothetical protein
MVDQLAGQPPDVQRQRLRPAKPWSPSGAFAHTSEAGVVQRQEAPVVQRQDAPMSPEEVAAYVASAREELDTHSRAEVNKRLHDLYDPEIAERAEQRFSGDLPDMTGVGSEVIMTGFVQAIIDLQSDWSTLDRDGRADRILVAANQALTDAGAMEMYAVTPADIPTPAHFSGSEWSMSIGEQYLTADSLTDEVALELAEIGLHETRHCEQYYRGYRWLAGYGATLDAMMENNPRGLPDAVIEAAHGDPLDASTGSEAEVEEGQEWFTALVSDADEAQAPIGDLIEVIEALLARWDVADAALLAFEADPTSESQETFEAELEQVLELAQRYEDTYAVYRQIVDEADAFEVGVSAGVLFSRLST